MRDRVIAFAVVVLFTYTLSSVVCRAQRRKPSTPEERAKAVQLAHSLETNPLDEDAKKARKWLEKWIEEVPDISVPGCSRLQLNTDKSTAKYAEELTTQMKFSIAAFIIEHPDLAEDPSKRIMAGITGMLRAYDSILKIDSNGRWDFLDSLMEGQSKHELEKYIRGVMARCSPVPLSDRTKKAYQAGDTVFSPIEVDRKAIIKRKPEPQYTREALAAGIKGVVVLQAVLASSGKVTDISVLKGLDGGLTQAAISAARFIRFEPATKDKRPVSTMVILEYHFGFYN